MKIRPVADGDRKQWLHMRECLWPDESNEHAQEIAKWFAGEQPEPMQVLVAEGNGRLIGFAELSIRPYAEKCHTQNVAYLEGWYVDSDFRSRGIGRALLEAAEQWGREQGCREFASDAQPNNRLSLLAHRACGFEDAGIVRCFRKDL